MFHRLSVLFACLLIALSLVEASADGPERATADRASARLPLVAPEDAGFDAVKLPRLDEVVARGLAEKRMPGCVVAFGRRGKLVWLKAYGDRQVEPQRVPMTVDTVFDLASLTKPIATATSILHLVDNKRLDIEQTVASVLPEFGKHGKESITIRHLLTHTSGLLADNALSDYASGPDEAWQAICRLSLKNPVGDRFLYSDVNFIVLGEVVKKVSGQRIDEYARENLYSPLSMHETGYRPGEALRNRCAPTEKREGEWMRGEVHDPRAFKLEGVAGHAGLFSTAGDLALFADMLLGRGSRGETRILSEEAFALMTAPQVVPLVSRESRTEGLRGLGWDMATGYSSNRGKNWSKSAFGHGGFTGTVIWIDPEQDLFFIFLSNRVHPAGKGLVNPLAGELGTIVGEAQK